MCSRNMSASWPRCSLACQANDDLPHCCQQAPCRQLGSCRQLRQSSAACCKICSHCWAVELLGNILLQLSMGPLGS